MRYISDDEMAGKNWRGRGSSSLVFREVMNIEVGKTLFIEKADWGNRKYSPSSIVRYIQKKYDRKFLFLREANGTGWAVKRLK
jgi:hypothetical protein